MDNKTKFRDYMVRERERDKQRYQEACFSKLPTIIEKLKSTEEPLSQSDSISLLSLECLLTKIKVSELREESEAKEG